jgi:hypothetical protein
VIYTLLIIILIAVVGSLIKERQLTRAYKKSPLYVAFEPEKYLADKAKQEKPVPPVIRPISKDYEGWS